MSLFILPYLNKGIGHFLILAFVSSKLFLHRDRSTLLLHLCKFHVCGPEMRKIADWQLHCHAHLCGHHHHSNVPSQKRKDEEGRTTGLFEVNRNSSQGRGSHTFCNFMAMS